MVLGGLDQCEGPVEEFIRLLHRYFRDGESRIRIVILTTTGKDTGITNMLSCLPPDTLREWIVDPKTFFESEDEQLPLKFRALLQRRPRLLADGVATILGRVLSAMNGDQSLQDMLLSWCGSTRICLKDVKKSLNLLSQQEVSSPEVVFEAILSRMPQEKHAWAKQLLLWVAFAARPLRVEEICLVSQVLSGQRGQSMDEDIMCWLDGILQVRHDEIHFSHPNFRPWLMRGSNGGTLQPESNLWYHIDADDASQAHSNILKDCLTYISSPEGYTTSDTWPGDYVFPYAWKYWTLHYNLAKSSQHFAPAGGAALAIFEDEAIFQRWINTYHKLADPLSLFDLETVSPVSAAAHFGLDDLLEILISKATPDQAVLPAMIEAARKGHHTTVKLLKQKIQTPLKLTDRHFRELIGVAASCGVDEILQEVMKLFPKREAGTNEGCHVSEAVWLSETLIKACWLGSKEFVQLLLDQGGDMYTSMPPAPDSTTPVNLISIAITVNSTEIVRLLLDRGWNLENESTLTRFVADNSTNEMAELLIEKGWDFKRRAEDGQTIVQRACVTGKPLLMELLLEKEPDFPQYIDTKAGGEPLLTATIEQNPETLQTLLRHGANVNVTDDKGNALYHSIDQENLSICRLLLEHPKEKDNIDPATDKVDVNYCAPDSEPPLVHAITALNQSDGKMLNFVKLLIENGADVNKPEASGWGRTALLIASASKFDGVEDVIKVLLDAGSEVNAKDSDDWTPLYTAASLSTAGVGKLLIEAGADVYAIENKENLNCLHVACRDVDFTRLLLDHGINPYQKYKADVTPLQTCVRENFTNSLEIMLAISDINKESVLTDALVEEFEKLEESTIRLLLDHGANVNRLHATSNMSLISLAMVNNREGILRLLLEYRPELNLVDRDENTALHCITESTSVASVKALVNATAKLDVLNKRRQSPLFAAIDAQNWDVVRYLLTRPVVLTTLNIPSVLGTPLHRACRLGTLDIIKSLIDSGADPSSYLEDAGTPLSEACLRRGDNYAAEKEDMIRFLLEKSDGSIAQGPDDRPGLLHNAALTCSEAIIRLFIERGANKTAEDTIGRRPLHLACYNSIQAVQALEVPDEEFAARDKVGRVPLHYAVMAAHSGSDESLLEYVLDKTRAAGLGIDVTDHDGWTPLLWSVRDSYVFEWADDDRHRDGVKTLKKLMENGADVGVLGRVTREESVGSTLEKQWSLLDVATYHGNDNLVKSLAETDEKVNKLEPRTTPRTGASVPGWYCDCCYLVSLPLSLQCSEPD